MKKKLKIWRFWEIKWKHLFFWKHMLFSTQSELLRVDLRKKVNDRRLINVHVNERKNCNVRPNSQGRPEANRLRNWYTSIFDQIVDVKEHHMSANEFQKILMKFPQIFNHIKPCAKIYEAFFSLFKRTGRFSKEFERTRLKSYTNLSLKHLIAL